MQEPQAWQQNPDQPAVEWLCNIVWGGNERALEKFSVPGLDGCLLSVPSADSPAGGDIYHVTVCGQGVFSKFLLIDVAGHGEAAAQISTRLQPPLTRLMDELDNSAILEELNHSILRNETAGCFATAAAATYNHWDRSFNYAYAGHPYMLIRRNGVWQQLPECCAGPPIGILHNLTYFQNEVRLNGSDWLFLFSDAILDIKRIDGTRLGFDGLIELLNRIDADASVGEFYQGVIDRLVHANNSARFQDDLTLILLKQQPPAKRLPARALGDLRRLIMRWMKRKESSCAATLPELPPPANV